MQQIGHLQRLKLKLSQNLIYQKKDNYARSITVETVEKILQEFRINDEDIALVKTIKPVFDPIHENWGVIPVFYNLKRLVTND